MNMNEELVNQFGGYMNLMKMGLAVAFVLLVLFAALFAFLIYRLWTNNTHLKKRLDDLSITSEPLDDSEIDVITDRVLECLRLDVQHDPSNPFIKIVLEQVTKEFSAHSTTSKDVELFEQTNSDVEFFYSKQGNILQEKCHTSEARFKVFNIKGDEANFTYCGGIINPDFLTSEVCDFENSPFDVPTINRIFTTVHGIVTKERNGKWRVTLPVKIRFE